MDPCPHRDSGKHELNALIPSDDDRDLTLFCGHCGAMRRVPATGSLWKGSPLDDWPANEIGARSDQAH